MTTPIDSTYIVTDPKIYGGKPVGAEHRIAGIDVAVWTQQGIVPEQIAHEYALTLFEIHAASSLLL